MSNNQRLDHHLVERGFYETRSRARDAILRGTVKINGAVVAKPATTVPTNAEIEIADPALRYVSRAALKLKAGLEASGFDPSGKTCLDLGASTGGFCQVLLEAGAAQVVAVDIGHGQLHPSVGDDPRMTSLEGVNARDLTPELIGGARVEFLTCDVSFISLRLALPPALALAEPDCKAIFLVKPQFEVGREAIGKGGIVRDVEAGERVATGLSRWLEAQQGWHVTGLVASPVTGADGNREYLLCAEKARG